MAFTFTGDIGAVEAFRAKLGAVSGLPKRVAVAAVPELEAIVAAEFEDSADPYGNPWAPMKDGNGDPLVVLADQVTVTASVAAIKLKTSGYLNFHNSGTRNVSKRRAAKALRSDLKARRFAAALSGESKGKAGRALRESFKAEGQGVKEAAASIAAASGVHDPKRPVIPNDAQGVPPTWGPVLESVAEAAFEALLRAR
jgi:hypothetical protein